MDLMRRMCSPVRTVDSCEVGCLLKLSHCEQKRCQRVLVFITVHLQDFLVAGRGHFDTLVFCHTLPHNLGEAQCGEHCDELLWTLPVDHGKRLAPVLRELV